MDETKKPVEINPAEECDQLNLVTIPLWRYEELILADSDLHTLCYARQRMTYSSEFMDFFDKLMLLD